jgi:hypothetical protein
MPTKNQAKAAVDSAVFDIKADIDGILPTGVNITDGGISFNPTKWRLHMNAGGVAATADSWLATIVTNLTTAGRASVVRRSGRRDEDVVAFISIDTALATYIIQNIG